MNHEKWIGKQLGEFIDYLNKNKPESIALYTINNKRSLYRIIELCTSEYLYLLKYYRKGIKNISISEQGFDIEI